MAATSDEIVQLLSVHSGEPVDYVAIVTLLNTVAGGHYEERHSEAAIRAALLALLRCKAIVVVAEDAGAPPPWPEAASGRTTCIFRLAPAFI
ncbi:MAG: hypothetical protein ACRD04_07245 [Terriglobales bacterium]